MACKPDWSALKCERRIARGVLAAWIRAPGPGNWRPPPRLLFRDLLSVLCGHEPQSRMQRGKKQVSRLPCPSRPPGPTCNPCGVPRWLLGGHVCQVRTCGYQTCTISEGTSEDLRDGCNVPARPLSKAQISCALAARPCDTNPAQLGRSDVERSVPSWS